LLLVGCGGGAPSASSSTAEATVHGTVTRAGKPLTKGRVTFDPANINRPTAGAATAEIAKDGTYTVRTLVDANQVSVDSPQLGRDPAGQHASIGEYVAKDGDNTFEVVIPTPQGLAKP
jgi:hypothetical protein